MGTQVNRPTEEQVQRMVCQYIKIAYPDIVFNTDLSGIKLTMGQARKVSKLRSSRSFPDIVIYKKKSIYGALFLELKRDEKALYKKDGSYLKSEHIKEQADMISKLTSLGYMAYFACGFDEAKNIIDNYLK